MFDIKVVDGIRINNGFIFMLLVDGSREVFQFLAADKIYAEIGVYKGEYSKGVKRYSPNKMFLIDPWACPRIDDLIPSDYVGDPVASLSEALRGYYPNSLSSSLESAYSEIESEFRDMKSCSIIRETSANAANLFDEKSLDVIYIDGNHRYDFVLADLERWSTKLTADGLIILNDCYVSALGKEQHLSVLEAVSTFIKLSDWKVVALNHRPWTDVVLARGKNYQSVSNHLKIVFFSNKIKFVELPGSLFHAARHKKLAWSRSGVSHSGEFMSFSDE